MGYNKTFQDQSGQIDHPFSTLAFVAVVILGLTSLLGFIGNGLVIWVILTKKNMKTPTNILILNLAVADFLVTVLVVPFVALNHQFPNNIFKTILCKLYTYVWYVSACVSGYTLVVMSLVRCILIVRPVTSKSLITIRRVSLAVAALWIIIMSGYSHVLVDSEVEEEKSVCHVDTYYFFALMFFVFGYVVPLCIMIIVYGILLIMLRYHTRSLESSPQRNRAHGHVTKMVIVVILCFLLCWLPGNVIVIVYRYGTYPQTGVAKACALLAASLALFNSCINPVLYAFLSSKFRQSFKQTCCCRNDDSDE